MTTTLRNYLLYLRPLLVAGFIALFFELIPRYPVYVAYAGNLDIARTFAFYSLFIMILALLLSLPFFLFSRILKESSPANGTTVKLSEFVSVLILGASAVRAFTRLFFKNADLGIYGGEWKAALLAVAIISLVVFLFVKRKEALRGAYLNLLSLLWPLVIVASIILYVITASNIITRALQADRLPSKKEALVAAKKAGALRGGELPNVFVITVDSLSADDMSLYGYRLKTTPFMDRLANDSFVFDSMHSNSSSTGPSMATFFTSKYAFSHGLYDSGMSLGVKRGENIAALFKRYGYRTAAVSGVWHVNPLYMGSTGDFDHTGAYIKDLPRSVKAVEGILRRYFDNRIPIDVLPMIRWIVTPSHGPSRGLRMLWRDAKPNLSEALDFIDASKGPVFCWIHLFPPHRPYYTSKPHIFSLLPAGKDEITLRDFVFARLDASYSPGEQDMLDRIRYRYNESILHVDDAIEGFVGGLKERGLFDDSLLVITSDHGESFTGGWFGHGSPDLHETELYVPLLIRLPGQKYGGGGARLSPNASLIDLAPTMIDAAGLPVPEWMQGRSLLPHMRGESSVDDGYLFATDFGPVAGGRPVGKGSHAIYSSGFKLVWNVDRGATSLFRLSGSYGRADESEDISNVESEKANELKGRLIEFLKKEGHL